MKKPVPYEKRKASYGYQFLSLWLIGTLIFFLYPLAESLKYSFMELSPGKGGMQGEWIGLKNYIAIFTADAYYSKYLIDVLIETLWKTPLIMIFSLLIAVILNQEFKGRSFARAVFFLPVIIATGPVYSIISGNLSGSGVGTQFSTIFHTDLTGDFFEFIGLYGISEEVQNLAEMISDHIFAIVWNSGIQILIFLAALQGIPSSVREAALIEGATGWEYFWKITLPYISPMILVCLIFTVIDSFISPDNAVMKRVLEMQQEWKYGSAAAMAWTYFIIVMFAIGFLTLIMRNYI